MHPSPSKIKKFKTIIWNGYKSSGRDLPWRHTTSPYPIFISEIMLQQTQVERVIPKYQAFLKDFPNFRSLAKSTNRNILKAWQGLGYNRRALYLKKIAEIIKKRHKGKIPRNSEELIMLPGIGKNTAGAILAYAFNIPVPFVETNIRRAYIYHFFPRKKKVSDADILALVERTMDTQNPREWYWALMDYGSMLAKKVLNPNRQSAGYKKQLRFEGSDRQLRGRIVRILLHRKNITTKQLIKILGESKSRIFRIASALQKEKLIKEAKNGAMFI